LLVIDIDKQAVLNTHEFERDTKLRLIPSNNPEQFILLASRNIPIERDEKTRKAIYADIVYLNTFDTHSGQQINRIKLGYNPTLVNLDERNESGYFPTRRSISKKGLTLWSIREGIVKKVMDTNLHYSPTTTFVREDLGVATILCGRRAVIMNLKTQTVSHDIKLPIDAVSGFMSDDGVLVFFREQKGSEIGVMDTTKGDVIGDSPTGSQGKKFAQALLSIAGVAIGAHTGFYYIAIPVATETTMMTDKQENYLYVINYSTGDVTIFNARSFVRLKTIPFPGVAALARYDGSPYMFVLSFGGLALIDSASNEVFRRYQQGRFAGINEEVGNAYFSDVEGLKIIDIATGDILHVVSELANVYLVVSSPAKFQTL